MSMIVSWNAELKEESEISVPLSSATYLRGEGVFETMRWQEGQITFCSDHLERLRQSAQRLGFDLPGANELEGRIRELVEANRLKTARVRLTLGQDLLITAEEFSEKRKSMKVMCGKDFPVNERGVLAGIKSTSYAENIEVLKRGAAVGADEVIRPNTRGELCEGCLSNVFFLRAGKLCTPSLKSGCLPGVMRKQVLRVFSVTEGSWPLEVLKDAEEIWLSNSLHRLRLVGEFEGQPGPQSSERLEEANALIEALARK